MESWSLAEICAPNFFITSATSHNRHLHITSRPEGARSFYKESPASPLTRVGFETPLAQSWKLLVAKGTSSSEKLQRKIPMSHATPTMAFRVICLGDRGVGKSELLRRASPSDLCLIIFVNMIQMLYRTYHEEYDPTIEDTHYKLFGTTGLEIIDIGDY